MKIGIVGASSLLGKELSEELGRSALAAAELVLFDETEVEGQLATAGEEIAFIRRIEEATLEGLDFVFFAGSKEQTLEYWETARQQGATVIDLSRALTEEPGAVTWAPWLRGGAGAKPDLQTMVVVPVVGAPMMLALMGDRLRAGGREARLFAATLLLPSSAYGRAAMDELHQQTVSLLSFQTVPQEVFAAQVAFNVLAAFGAEAKVSLSAERAAIAEQYARLSGGTLPELGLQVVQVPVFHGYTASLFVELAEAASVAELEAALAGEHVRVVPQDAVAPARQGGASAGEEEEDEPEAEGDAAPSNLAAAGQDEILVRVTADGTGDRGTRFWIWMAADHLRLATAAAVECALHMRRLRPQGAVQ